MSQPGLISSSKRVSRSALTLLHTKASSKTSKTVKT